LRATGHYKAEEWQESSKSWILNDQLGVQIVVAVRPSLSYSSIPCIMS